ncbi:hypothetical protein BCP78_0049 [Bacillus phage BCP78]|uniref:Uncharacterized protein n=2 Tax=Tsarbombavirus BCP78 TaxID=1985182 RepID=J9Q9D9_9CAUD|nr:hypothetical protein BCP78_0049 [Bacillus phage BCP78]YP_009783413.1 hypothetical protein QLX27_gp040 [Bacillus phage BCU4]AEW47056.1 hypothetical protein BCP78_0049 [Bacillus phage BCP78]AEW47546.1 hypothetical protein BCU4_0040 [Bacillus phage BCU4]
MENEKTYKGFAALEKMKTNWLVAKGSNICAYCISGNRLWVMELDSPSKEIRVAGAGLNYFLANEFVVYKEGE